MLSKSDHRRPSYGVTTIFKMAVTPSQTYLRFPLWSRAAVKNVKIYLHTKFRQRTISTIHGRDITIRFLKINGCHIEILLPFSIWTVSLTSACDSALAYQMLCKLDYRWRSYDVILILKMAAIASQIYFRLLVWPLLTFRKV